MLNNLNRPYPFLDDLWLNLKAIVGISLGLFLFILFFQPFYLSGFEFNTQLMIIAGYGGIVLLVLTLNNIVMPSIFPRLFLRGSWKLYMDLILQLVSWAMLSVAFNFYTRYVGQVPLNVATSIRIILIALIPVSALIIVNRSRMLRMRNRELEEITRSAGILPAEKTENPLITIPSENKSDELTVRLSDILFIQAANNYIEIQYLEGGAARKDLIRCTLKRAEDLLMSHPCMLRCHRSTLVNSDHILRLTGMPGNLRLKVRNSDVEVPVSRQYLQSVKDALKGRRGE